MTEYLCSDKRSVQLPPVVLSLSLKGGRRRMVTELGEFFGTGSIERAFGSVRLNVRKEFDVRRNPETLELNESSQRLRLIGRQLRR